MAHTQQHKAPAVMARLVPVKPLAPNFRPAEPTQQLAAPHSGGCLSAVQDEHLLLALTIVQGLKAPLCTIPVKRQS